MRRKPAAPWSWASRLLASPEAWGDTVLFLLNPNSAVRRAVASALARVAETIGGADWQPAHMAFGETLAKLIAEVPKATCAPATLASVLRKSNELEADEMALRIKSNEKLYSNINNIRVRSFVLIGAQSSI